MKSKKKSKKSKIGVILAQNQGQGRGQENRFYIHADTEKWIVDAGIEIVPIFPTVGKDEAVSIFACIHGLYLQPGEPGDFSDMNLKNIQTSALFLTMAIESNKAGHYFPVWGTCMGLQQIVSHIGGVSIHSLKSFDSTDHRAPLTIVYPKSRLLQYYGFENEKISEKISEKVNPWFNNMLGIQTLNTAASKILRVVATARDKKGAEFIAIVEGKTFPIYGVQFHPEKDSKFKWMSTFLHQELKLKSKRNHISRTRAHFME